MQVKGRQVGTPGSVKAPSRVKFVDAATVNSAAVAVTETHTVYGLLCTASVNDILLDAAFCHTSSARSQWQREVQTRFEPTVIDHSENTIWAKRIFNQDEPIHVITPKTAFRHSVHAALTHIPPGTTVSYATVAAQMGQPLATRAVASAIAANRIAVVIPCHRVWRSDATPGGFRWGQPTKIRLCADEQASTV